MSHTVVTGLIPPEWLQNMILAVLAVAALAIFSPVLFETDLATEGASTPPPAAYPV